LDEWQEDNVYGMAVLIIIQQFSDKRLENCAITAIISGYRRAITATDNLLETSFACHVKRD